MTRPLRSLVWTFLRPMPPRDCAAVLADLGALAVAVLADGEERAVVAHHLHRHDVVALAQLHAADAVGRPAHRPRVGLGEADRHAVARADHEILAAVGFRHGDQPVVVVDLNRDDAGGARIRERAEIGLLDRALAACPSR